MKTFYNVHTLVQGQFHNRQVTTRWVAKIYLDKPRRISRLIDIKEGIKDDYQVGITMCKAFKCWQLSIDLIQVRRER